MTATDAELAKRVHEYFEALLKEGFRRQEAVSLASMFQHTLLTKDGSREPWE